MKGFIFSLILFLPLKSMALEAVVTVLEAPLFRTPSYDAFVVQYKRKGDVIKIHPSLGNDRDMDEYSPSVQKLQHLKEKMRASPEYWQDPLFSTREEAVYYPEDEFIPTLDRQGNLAYILSQHIYIYFADRREFSQSIPAKDMTDYRLEEPLPRNYPFKIPTGYRGQFVMGFTQPYFESYPYEQSIQKKGYTAPIEFSGTLLREAPGNYQQRLFIGGTLSFRSFSNTYSFEDRRFSEETVYRFGLGPTISYDAFKGEKNRLNLSGTIILNLLDRFVISQRLDDLVDDRIYTGYSLSPRINLQYHRKKILPETDLDFVVGTSLEVSLATRYRAINGGGQEGWWQALGNDQFTTDTTFNLGGYIGIQSAY